MFFCTTSTLQVIQGSSKKKEYRKKYLEIMSAVIFFYTNICIVRNIMLLKIVRSKVC